MNNVKNVLQVVINIEAAETVQDLKSIIQATIGDVDIIKYAVNPKNVVLYIESQPSDKLHTIKIEDSGKKYSIINVVESIIELNSKVYSGTVSEVFSEKELDEPLAAMAILFDTDPQIDYLLTKEFKISNLSSYDGLLSISTDNGLVLIEKQCNVVIDYSTYNPETGTVRLAQTSRSEEVLEETVANDSTIHELHGDDTDFIKSETLLSEQASKQMINLLSDLDAIDNNKPYELHVNKLPHDGNVEAMQEIINVMKSTLFDGSKLSLDGIEYSSHETTPVIETELSTEELESITKGYRTIINIEANVETISFDKFDDMAEKYHIVGWELSTPNTLSITFIEGTTPESTVKKFHDMMNGLDSRLINTEHFNNLKELEESTKFLAELRNIISDDTDVAQEFVNRVKKHNIFVRETMAKMRSALLDMENDFERVLKDEVNLSIDWETLTAFAAKKERTEIRTSGVKKGVKLDVENNNGYSLVKVITNEKNGDFYIPLSLVTDDIRSTYELDDYYYYIEFVPNYAFYEVLVNGHVMLIEKTDL